jgi:hypothetical protein
LIILIILGEEQSLWSSSLCSQYYAYRKDKINPGMMTSSRLNLSIIPTPQVVHSVLYNVYHSSNVWIGLLLLFLVLPLGA